MDEYFIHTRKFVLCNSRSFVYNSNCQIVNIFPPPSSLVSIVARSTMYCIYIYTWCGINYDIVNFSKRNNAKACTTRAISSYY